MNVLVRLIVAGLLAAVAVDTALAQRVEFPSPYADPYSTPVTPYPATPYPGPAPGPIGPPPTFDPYATTPAAPPPVSLPYTYTPPGTPAPAAPVDPWAAPAPPPGPYTQQPGAIMPQGFPFEWQPGSYGYQSPDGTWVKVQRFLQEISLEYTWLYGDHADVEDFEINRAELSSTFAVPMFYNTESPLLVTPGFAANFLEGPIGLRTDVPPGPELPPRLYDAYLDFAWYPKVTQWLGGELGFRTGVWSDFDHVTTDSVRFLGRGLASISLTPQFDILFGAVYLDRVDVKLLPAGGVYWRPTPEWDLYLVFPNPKARKRLMNIGNSQWYWYVAGEYGMGSWTVDRPNGMDPPGDRIDINDIRVSGGLEWETQTRIRGHIEAGYVFDREIIFVSGEPANFKPDDTFMLRGGVDF